MSQRALPRPVARAVDAVKRRIFQYQLRRWVRPDVAVRLVRYGSEWGGWTIPAGVLDRSSICYCAGAGGDVSFDLALLGEAGATVRSVDPNAAFGEEALAQAGRGANMTFICSAVAAADGSLTMYRSWDAGSGTASAENIYRTSEPFSVPAQRLSTLMREAGDERIDLLKLDIEGSEYDVLEALDPVALGLRVICVEFHHTSSARRARRIVERLSRDYGVAHVSGRSDVTLVRRAGAQHDEVRAPGQMPGAPARPDRE